jgi:hypothetical protein
MSDPQVQTLAAQPDNSKPTTENQTTVAEPKSGEGLKFDGLGDEDKAKLARFKTQNDLGKSYLELERRLGASVVLPGKNAKAEDVEAFYEKLGRPKSPDGYELDPVYLPDNVTQTDPDNKEFRKIAHQIGLSKEQAKALNKWSVDSALAQAAAFRKKVKEDTQKASEDLRKEHGLNYDQKLALVKLVNNKFGDDNWIRYLNTGPGNDPNLLRFLIKVGEAISEDTLVRGRPAPATAETREPGILSYPNRPEITGRQRFRTVR